MDTLKIGRYIQHLRKATGMTQKELAERLNVSSHAVSKWENGDALPFFLIYAILWTPRQISCSTEESLWHVSAG